MIKIESLKNLGAKIDTFMMSLFARALSSSRITPSPDALISRARFAKPDPAEALVAQARFREDHNPVPTPTSSPRPTLVR